MHVKLYHNAKCSKSCKSLAILEENNVSVEAINYLDSPPSVEELLKICTLLNKKPVEIIRTKETLFSQLGLSVNDYWSDEQWCQILHDNPILIERPIVVSDNKAALGRPPENVLSILDP